MSAEIWSSKRMKEPDRSGFVMYSLTNYNRVLGVHNTIGLIRFFRPLLYSRTSMQFCGG